MIYKTETNLSMICVKFTLSNKWCTVNQEETEIKNKIPNDKPTHKENKAKLLNCKRKNLNQNETKM